MKTIIMGKNLLFLSFIFVSSLFSVGLHAQAYDTAVGIRIGSDYGATIQQRLTKKWTLEGLYYGGFREENVHANLIAQRHFPILTRRTNFYIGAGVGSHWIYNDSSESFGEQRFTIPAVIGLELSLGRLNISGDIMPHYIFDDNKLTSLNSVAALSVRYILVKKKPAKKIIDKVEDRISDLNKKAAKNKKKNKKKKK